MKHVDIKKLVFIDESGVQNNMTRNYGRSIGGKRLHEAVPGKTWDTTTVISSIRYDGLVAPMTIKGPIDSEVFKTYVSKILCPTLNNGDMVIMDNLPTHKVPGVVELIEGAGAEVVYLPPYSPDFNPIEKMWSKIKSVLRKIKARSKIELNEAFSVAFDDVTPSDAHGWFKSCGYVLIHS